jgi:hypothetical protein
MPDTAKGLKVDANDIDQNIRGGIKLLKELMSDKTIGNDPYKVLAAYNTSTATRKKFLESGDLKTLPTETINHMINVSEFYGGDLPSTEYVEPAKEAEQPQPKPFVENAQKAEPPRVPRLPAGVAGAQHGAALGATAGLTAGGYRLKYDIAQLIAQYPDAMAAFKAGKPPGEVINIALKHLGPQADLPPPTGPMTGTPAGGRMTQNWIKSQDTPGAYADVGLQARDLKEAHEMKRAAMAAEDKIKSIAPEFGVVPERGGLFLSQSAGQGPSPRFGGTPTQPIPPVAPAAAESASVAGALGNFAKHYLPYAKAPVLGGLTGFNLYQGAADIHNRIRESKPGQAVLSALGTLGSTAAPFLAGEAAVGATGLGALVPAYLYMQDNPEAKEKFVKAMQPGGAYQKRMEGRFGLD